MVISMYVRTFRKVKSFMEIKMQKSDNENIYCYKDQKTFAPVLGNVRMLTKKNFRCDMHMQEFFEINIITEGKGKHYIGDNIVDAEIGDVFVVPPMVKHAYTHEGALEVFHILIGNKFIEKNIAELQKIPSFFVLFTAEPLMRATAKAPLHLHLDDEQFTKINKLLCESLEYQVFDDAFDAVVRSSYCMMIIALLCEIYTENSKKDRRVASNEDELFMQVISMIHERYYEKLTITNLARMAQISRSLFIKRFKEICGLPPLEYISRQRIEAAEQMLLNTNLSIVDIAFKCGFYDAAHFAKIFIKKNGISPSVYRKTHITSNNH